MCVLLFALIETICDTAREKIEHLHELKEKQRYEDINFRNIESVTLDGVETAYRTETEEEFDPLRTDFLSRQDGWQHYETNTVEYEVEDGLNYLFTIQYKNGTTIYRKFHESSGLTAKLLGYCNQNNEISKEIEDAIENRNIVTEDDSIIINGIGNTSNEQPIKAVKKSKDRFAVIDFETTGLNYNFRNPPMDEILSVSIVDQDGNELLNTYCDTIKIKSWYKAQEIHGISPRDVKGYPTFVEIMPKVIEILSSYDYVISYNVPFEKSFLEGYVQLYTPKDFSVHKIKWGPDPMEMFMRYMGSMKFLKLKTAAEHFGYKYKAHDSMEDVKAALHVYNALRGE